MRRLSECPVDGPGAARRRCEYHLVDRKDGTDDRRDPLTPCITGEKHEFVVYALDRAEVEWDGKRPDGVLIMTSQDAYWFVLSGSKRRRREIRRDGRVPGAAPWRIRLLPDGSVLGL